MTGGAAWRHRKAIIDWSVSGGRFVAIVLVSEGCGAGESVHGGPIAAVVVYGFTYRGW